MKTTPSKHQDMACLTDNERRDLRRVLLFNRVEDFTRPSVLHPARLRPEQVRRALEGYSVPRYVVEKLRKEGPLED